jgi:hypothetical protein
MSPVAFHTDIESCGREELVTTRDHRTKLWKQNKYYIFSGTVDSGKVIGSKYTEIEYSKTKQTYHKSQPKDKQIRKMYSMHETEAQHKIDGNNAFLPTINEVRLPQWHLKGHHSPAGNQDRSDNVLNIQLVQWETALTIGILIQHLLKMMLRSLTCKIS